MAGASRAYPGAASETQYMRLLTLLSEHGSKLSHSHRAQHLTVAHRLLAELHHSAFAVMAPFALRTLSAYAASCAEQTSVSSTLADDEPALIALFGLVSATCGCLGAEDAYDLIRRPVSAQKHVERDLAPETDDIGGLFGRPSAPHPVVAAADAVIPPAFVPSPVTLTTVQRALHVASPTVQGAAAHIISLACDTATVQRAVRVRAAALTALCALVRVLPPALLAAFFPGIASKTLRILVKVRLHQSVLAVLALDLLAVAVAAIFPPCEKPQASVGGSSFADLVGALRIAEPPALAQAPQPRKRESSPPKRKRPQNLSVDRDVMWYANASKSLSPLLRAALESADGPRLHSNSRARHALAVFLDIVGLRESSLQLAPVVRWQCLYSLAELAADSYSDVRDEACTRLRNRARENAYGAEDTENGLRALMKHISRMHIAAAISGAQISEDEASEADDDSSASEAEALEKLFPTNDELQRWTLPLEGFLIVLGADGVADILPRLNCDTLAVALVALQSAVWTPSAIGEPSQYELMHTRALSACFALGRAGLLPALHAPLLRVADTQQIPDLFDSDQRALPPTAPRHSSPAALVHHTHAVLCLQALTRGAAETFTNSSPDAQVALTWPQLLRYVIDLFGSAAAVVLPLDEAEAGHGWADAGPRRAKQAVLMCIAELCNILSALRAPDRQLGAGLALPVLIALLSDAARDDPDVVPAAEHALEALAAATGCVDSRALVRRHSNFLVARLVRSLHLPAAGPLLRYIVTRGNDPVCSRVVALAEQALTRQCDDLAAVSDARATAALAAIHAVLAAAPTPPAVSGVCSFENGPDRELRELSAMLMAYCTDEVPEDEGHEAFPVTKEDDDELNDEEREERRTPFQRLARSALAGVADVLVGRPAVVRVQALRAAARGVHVLAADSRALLPAVATLLPLLPVQLAGSSGSSASIRGDRGIVAKVNALGQELPVIASACVLLAAIVRTAGTFVRSRFVRNIFPALRPLLVLVGHDSGKSAKLGEMETPSFGALAAADAALECVAAVAQTLPDALRPFAEELLGYVAHYVSGAGESRKLDNFARRRYERRSVWAEIVMKGIAVADPDRTWVGLVVEGGPDNVTHWEGDRRMQTLLVR